MGQNRKTRKRKKINRPKRVYRQSTAPWHLYIIECENGALYTGITNEVERRLAEHKSGKGGHYTRAHLAKKIIHSEQFKNRSEALKRESQIKTWTRQKKLDLINTSRGSAPRIL